MTPFSTRPDRAATSLTVRRPWRSRSRWTTRSMAPATVGTTKALETFSPASSGNVQILMTASRAELAWIVHMAGSPEFVAISRSRASASRTSPMMRRSGRMRRASLTRRRRLISPTPSRLGGRVCIATQSRFLKASSKTSSQEMTLWPPGMAPARALTMVVFPAWVAPETRMLRPD